MNQLKPGFIPRGWRKGDKLQITPARPGERGWVSLSYLDKGPGTMSNDDMYLIEFRYEDGKDVQEWLEWWRGK